MNGDNVDKLYESDREHIKEGFLGISENEVAKTNKDWIREK